MEKTLDIQEKSSAGCGCHSQDEETPVLDVRTIPHRIRHGSVHGAFDALNSGEAMILVAPRLPRPLLAELDARSGIAEMELLEEGPKEWRLKITKR